MDVAERRRTAYRVPVTALLVPFGPFVVAAFWLRWLGGVVFVAVFGLLDCWRPVLELTEHGAVVRVYGRRLVPWESVTGIRGGGWFGGLVLTTRSFEDIRVRAPCSWWGGPAPAEEIAVIEQWWVEHRGPGWTPRRPLAPPAGPTKPPVRYRAAEVAGPVAVIGLLVALVNGAALWWPSGGFSVGFLEVTEPSLDDLGWSIVAAIGAGAAVGAAWVLMARRILTGDGPPPAAADARPADAARPLLVIAAVGAVVAAPQWLGIAPGLGSLTMLAAGVAVAVAAGPLAVAAHRFERRTGRLLLCTNPIGRGLGLEAGPPA